jgi:twitching motility protein PilT
VSYSNEDLDRLVSQLAADAEATAEVGAKALAPETLTEWLARVRELDGSDLLLVSGLPPVIRGGGRLHRASHHVMDSEDVLAAVRDVLSPRLFARFTDGGIVDCAFSLPKLGRFRMNLHRERGRSAAAIRALPLSIPSVSQLHFSHDISLLTTIPRGLVILGGPTGSGKTTTMAALVAAINARDQRHIITVEDPIEYEHHHGRSVVEQVEIGVDAPDFPTALRATLRQMPDVLVVGEMRDPETMRIALAAAETGHLVLATIHATDAAAAVSRIADAFPSERQNAVRQELAMALSAILTQTLMPSVTGALIPVAELLMISYGARQHVRKNALQHLHQEISITRKSGSFTLEESLVVHVRKGFITREDARLRAAHPEEFDANVQFSPP